jgi:hypothetical protein
MPFTYFVFLFLLPLVAFWVCLAAAWFLGSDRRPLLILAGVWALAFLVLLPTRHYFPFIVVQAVTTLVAMIKLRLELL